MKFDNPKRRRGFFRSGLRFSLRSLLILFVVVAIIVVAILPSIRISRLPKIFNAAESNLFGSTVSAAMVEYSQDRGLVQTANPQFAISVKSVSLLDLLKLRRRILVWQYDGWRVNPMTATVPSVTGDYLVDMTYRYSAINVSIYGWGDPQIEKPNQ
ncbi:MAG: hypothetical protein AAF939_04290 [Planctomycetota bacterium]